MFRLDVKKMNKNQILRNTIKSFVLGFLFCNKISNKYNLKIKEFIYFAGTSHCKGKTWPEQGQLT